MLAGIDAAGESLIPTRGIPLLLFSFPALLCSRLELAQCLCRAAVTKPKCGEVAGWERGGTLSFYVLGMSGAASHRSARGEQLGQTAPFGPRRCHIGKKIGSDSYCRFPSSLTRAWQGDGTRRYSQACHLLTQQLWWQNSEGGMLDPAPYRFTNFPLIKFLAFVFVSNLEHVQVLVKKN